MSRSTKLNKAVAAHKRLSKKSRTKADYHAAVAHYEEKTGRLLTKQQKRSLYKACLSNGKR